jgi:beta-fructofuranosidase
MKAELSVATSRLRAEKSLFRQAYHFMAPVFWMNDPTGPVVIDGKYHLFYQYNPYAPQWGAMHWGHALSEDMLQWEHLPIVLAPSEEYDFWEQGGCFSGSSVFHNGILYVFYTGVCEKNGGIYQTQCLAISTDKGTTFTKFNGNPLIHPSSFIDPANFRDPKVWEHRGSWYMLVGASVNGNGALILYRSKDLIRWHYVNITVKSQGTLGFMWECPDYFRLKDKDVLVFSPMGIDGSKAVYLTGIMDYEKGIFLEEHRDELDWGFDYYATQSFSDNNGRRIMYAWANSWTWMPWWKNWGPAVIDQWCGALAIPREIWIDESGRLRFLPIKELKCLRSAHHVIPATKLITDRILEINDCNGTCCEIIIRIDLSRTSAGGIRLMLRKNHQYHTDFFIDLIDKKLIFDRTASDIWNTGIRNCSLSHFPGNELGMHIFIDRSSIELFTCNYLIAMSGNVYAPEEANKMLIQAVRGEVFITGIETWNIIPVSK